MENETREKNLLKSLRKHFVQSRLVEQIGGKMNDNRIASGSFLSFFFIFCVSRLVKKEKKIKKTHEPSPQQCFVD